MPDVFLVVVLYKYLQDAAIQLLRVPSGFIMHCCVVVIVFLLVARVFLCGS